MVFHTEVRRLKYWPPGRSKRADALLQHLDMCGGFGDDKTKFKLSAFKEVCQRWQSFMQENGGWHCAVPITTLILYRLNHSNFTTGHYLENHDQPRSVSLFLDDGPKHRDLCAKALALLNMTMSGTIFIYQGQEIGMINVPADWPIENYPDLVSQEYYAELSLFRYICTHTLAI